MDLRQKALLTLTSAFIVIIIVLSAFSSGIILSSYNALESRHVQGEVILVNNHMNSEISGLLVLARDWGSWDDLYAFTRGENAAFIAKNLDLNTLSYLHLNFLVVTDSQGHILYITGFDPVNETVTPVPKGILQEIADNSSPLRDLSTTKGVAGFLSLPDGPVFVAAAPILHSDSSGTPAGMIIMGRKIDTSIIGQSDPEEIPSLSNLPLSGQSQNQSLQGNTLVPDTGRQDGQPAAPVRLVSGITGSDVTVLLVGEDTIEGSTLVKDIRGNNAFVFTLQMPRDIYQQGKSTLFTCIIILAFIALIIGLIVIYLIDSQVLSRLSALSIEVSAIGGKGDLSSRLTFAGDDEIALLATSWNTTLEKLESAHKNLQKSEERYRTLIETSPASIAQTDLMGMIVYCNLQMARSHGYPAMEDLRGKFLFDFIVPEDQDRARTDFAQALTEGPVRNIEYRGLRRDATTYWLDMSISVNRDWAGKPDSFIIVSRDISDRKTWESQLRESEQLYRTIFESTGTATAIVRGDTTISLANSGFERLSGHAKEELENRVSWMQFVVPEDREKITERLSELRDHPSPVPTTLEIRFGDRMGTVHDCINTVEAIPGTEDFVSSLMDITTRKQAEDTVRKSEGTLNAVIEFSPIPLFVIDRDHRVIYWNRALEICTGVDADSVIGTDRHWTAFYPEARPCIVDLVIDNLIEKIPGYYEGKYTRSVNLPGIYEVTDFFPRMGHDGRWLHFTAAVIRDSGGESIGAVETLVDITDRKRTLEEISRTNEQLTAAMEELQATEEILRDNINELQRAKLELQVSEAKYRDIATNIPGIVVQIRIQGDNQYAIPFISDRAFQMFCLMPEEIYKNAGLFFGLIHPRDTGLVRQSLLDSSRLMVPWNLEFRLRCRGDEYRWFSSRAVPHIVDKDNMIWNGVLIDITERRVAEEALTESERIFRAIFDESSAFMGLMNADGTIVKLNRSYLDFCGIANEAEVSGLPLWQIPCWAHSEEMREKMKSATTAAAGGEFVRFEATNRSMDGSLHYLDFSLKPVVDESHSVVLLIPEGHDITERKLLQEEVGRALQEKEMLLKEIHHRVKNNIQVIASLLNMQSRTTDDVHIRDVLREAQNRVKSIALIHEKLYQSRSLDHIDYNDYLQKISRHLYESYGISPRVVVMNIRAENISLHIDKAIPCSLIINELLSNAFKHAFPEGRKGNIWIDIRQAGDTLVVEYRDDGIGLPGGISLEHAETLGMRLLYGLTKQLDGTIELRSCEGTCITITFPV
jgi:PAS domain S-box-containing protein